MLKSITNKMRRLFFVFLILSLVLSLFSCSGNYAQIDLKAPVELPENGVIEKEIFDQIKQDGAIAVFTGKSEDLVYEWTIFGNDLVVTRSVNLSLDIEENEGSVKITFAEKEDFGFPAFLSVHLSEKWAEQSATAYFNDLPVNSVSVTGTKKSILNISVNEITEYLILKADSVDYVDTVYADTTTVIQPEPEKEENNTQSATHDSYLSGVSNSDDRVYSENVEIIVSGGTTENKTQSTDHDGYLSDVNNTDDQVYSEEADIVIENNPTEIRPTEQDGYLSSSDGSDDTVYSGTVSSSDDTVENTAPQDQDNYLSDSNNSNDQVYSGSGSASVQNGSYGGTVQAGRDNYLTNSSSGDGRVYSDGNSTEKDKYETDPVPVGKPMPVEPEDQQINTQKTYTCTLSIECSTILNNLGDLDPDKRELVPSNGVILTPTKVTFYEGESVYDVLLRVCRQKGIHLEYSWTPIYNSAYIEGIHNLYEFDCGSLSGWMYCVNGWYPNYGCSRYQLVDGEVIEWRYTCDLGADVGRDMRG